MGLQSCGSPNFGNFGNFENFGTPDLGVLGQNDIWAQPLWPCIENTIRGGGGFPQVRAVVSLVSSCMPMTHPCTKSAPTTH
jgi:hypothetical protein